MLCHKRYFFRKIRRNVAFSIEYLSINRIKFIRFSLNFIRFCKKESLKSNITRPWWYGGWIAILQQVSCSLSINRGQSGAVAIVGFKPTFATLVKVNHHTMVRNPLIRATIGKSKSSIIPIIYIKRASSCHYYQLHKIWQNLYDN